MTFQNPILSPMPSQKWAQVTTASSLLMETYISDRSVFLSSQLLHCHPSHSDLFSAVSWYRIFLSGDAICLFPDSTHIITESSFLHFSHKVYPAYLPRKGRARVFSSNCSETRFLTLLLHQLRDIFAQLADAPSPQGITNSQPAPPCPVLCSTSQLPCETVNDNNPPSTHQTRHPPKSATTVDVLTWLCRATLDVIGEAGMSLLMPLPHALISVSGFGYSFHSLPTPGTDPSNADKTDNELARAFATMFSPQHQFSKLTVLAIWFPFLKRLVRYPYELRPSS